MTTIEIVAGRDRPWGLLADVWRHRELAAFLVWRDLKVRYRQTVFGAAWAVLQPVGLMSVFWVFLGHLARVPSGDVPYGVFVLAGLVPWIYCSNVVDAGANSMVTNLSLVTKVHFPRILLPLTAGITFLLDLLIGLALLLAIVVLTDIELSPAVLVLPFLIVWLYVVAVSVGTMFAGLSVRYRDLRHALRFVLQLWMFLSPVAYPISLVPDQWRTLYGLNPLAGLIGTVRWAVVGDDAPGGWVLAASLGITLVLAALGVSAFLHNDDLVADLS
jgi:lipopolysaccharide transport system permease protein